MPKQQVDNIKFNYECFGEGEPTIVFISGYTCDIDLWRSIAEALSDKQRVLIFDNEGIGETVDDSAPLTIESMANHTKALMDALGIERPVIVGYAMGTNIALEIAHQYPNYPQKLILLSPVLKWSEQAKAYVDELISLREADRLDEYFVRLYMLAFGEAFRKRVSLDAFKEQMRPTLVTQTIADQKRQAAALRAFDATAWAHEISIPAIVLSPTEDQFATPKDAEAVAHAIQADLVKLDCGHASIAEIPEEVIRFCRMYSGPVV